jgi:hypothetical protein
MFNRLIATIGVIVAALPGAAVAGDKHVDLAIGVNPPIIWTYERSIGISAYAGITNHQAIRANFAKYEYDGDFARAVGGILTHTSEGQYTGDFLDASVAWMYFPRRLWSGPSFEAGLLRRARDTYYQNEYESPEVLDTMTATYGARALVGYSVLIANHVFISVATGLSAGYEHGHETFSPMLEPWMLETRDVGRLQIDGEFFFCIGGAFSI